MSLGELKCQCCLVGVHQIREGKGGTLSGTCSNSGCRSQLMVKSPAGVMALRKRLDPAAAAPAAAAQAAQASTPKKSFLDDL